MKEKVLAKTTPPDGEPGRYRPDDKLLDISTFVLGDAVKGQAHAQKRLAASRAARQASLMQIPGPSA